MSLQSRSWGFSYFTAVALLVPSAVLSYLLYKTHTASAQRRDDEDPGSADRDHPLLKEYSSIKSYRTEHATYDGIRTFYRPHSHLSKLPAISELPLLVFVHGVGGSLSQFGPLLGSLTNIAPCFGIELPGHGASAFSPTDYNAYRLEALTGLWRQAITETCSQQGHKSVVMISHSLGCSIATLLAVSESPSIRLECKVVGLVAICPTADRPTVTRIRNAQRFLSLPNVVLDVLRWFDRRGGPNSSSVERFVGKGAGVDLRRLQLRYNQAFSTSVWKRVMLGCLPRLGANSSVSGGLPGAEIWAKIQVPLFLLAGEADSVTKPTEITRITAAMQSKSGEEPKGLDLPPSDTVPTTDSQQPEPLATSNDEMYGIHASQNELKSRHAVSIKSAILPAPAAHAIMYDHSTYRTVAGLIEDFLARFVSKELSLGWQLQNLTTSGKWDVKNLEKWKKVIPVSAPIANNTFRALKTLREQDQEHTPKVFVERWKDEIYAIVDISHETPVYDTNVVERGGIHYHKFPTVSKIPPTDIEVKDFNALIERLLLEEEAQRQVTDLQHRKAIGVHCHYGFNRTGFFLVCYLVEKCGRSVQDAIDEFASAKPPGIKHDHFIDTLFVRYCKGLRRASTIESAETT